MSVSSTDALVTVTGQTADFDTPFPLTGGATLPTWRLAYETYGTPNTDMSNAVLVCHALSGSQHAAGRSSENSKEIGWWDNFIGPGKPVDTNKFFVVSSNNLGGCHGSSGPSSPHPQDGRPYGSRFPVVTVEDWVRAQKMLAERLGVRRFAAVIGGSLGGMQALRWAIDYPDCVQTAVIIAAAARLTASNIAFNDIARQAILGDPQFHGGDYYEHGEYPRRGLGVARMLGHVTYLSEQALAAKFGRLRKKPTARFDYGVEFEVESYLRYQGDKFSGRFDANTYLLMTRALDYFDPAQDADDDLTKALSPVTAEFLLVSFSSDWRFPPAFSREMLRHLLAAGKRASYVKVQSGEGHDSFLLANPVYHRAVGAFMNCLAEKLGKVRLNRAL
ncbi:MAG: homoserine O-acetyltransferase [Candidatus Zeuxoniibacter abyssi]|nr:MAG: homoserine O-acetyltransferase [Candidatus Persebacteraceae bacterium AB1(2)]